MRFAFSVFALVVAFAFPASALDWPTITLPSVIQASDGSLRAAYPPITLAPGETVIRESESLTPAPGYGNFGLSWWGSWPQEYEAQVRRVLSAYSALDALHNGFSEERVNAVVNYIATVPRRAGATQPGVTVPATYQDDALQYHDTQVPVYTEPHLIPRWYVGTFDYQTVRCGPYQPGPVADCRQLWGYVNATVPITLREEGGTACAAYATAPWNCPWLKAFALVKQLGADAHFGWAVPSLGHIYLNTNTRDHFTGRGLAPEDERFILDALAY